MERGVIMEVLSPSTPITQKYYKRSLIHTRRSELKSKKCVAILVSMTAFQVRRFGDVAFAKIRVTLCSTSRQCLCRRCKSIHVSPCFLWWDYLFNTRRAYAWMRDKSLNFCLFFDIFMWRGERKHRFISSSRDGDLICSITKNLFIFSNYYMGSNFSKEEHVDEDIYTYIYMHMYIYICCMCQGRS